MKSLPTLQNPDQKRASFKCRSCRTTWIKPVNFYIRRPHPAIAALVPAYEHHICKKCALRECGPKNKKRKWFFNEE